MVATVNSLALNSCSLDHRDMVHKLASYIITSGPSSAVHTHVPCSQSCPSLCNENTDKGKVVRRGGGGGGSEMSTVNHTQNK